jgi:hypothetical protein
MDSPTDTLVQHFSQDAKKMLREQALISLDEWVKAQGPAFVRELEVFHQSKGKKLISNLQRVMLWKFAFRFIGGIREADVCTVSQAFLPHTATNTAPAFWSRRYKGPNQRVSWASRALVRSRQGGTSCNG